MNHLIYNPPKNGSQPSNKLSFLAHLHSTPWSFPTEHLPRITRSLLPTDLILP